MQTKNTEFESPFYDHFLGKSSSAIRRIFFNLKQLISDHEISICEQINKSMLSLKMKNRGVIWLQPGVNYLIVYLAKGRYDSPFYEIFNNGWGGYPYIRLTEENFEIRSLSTLIGQATLKINSIVH